MAEAKQLKKELKEAYLREEKSFHLGDAGLIAYLNSPAGENVPIDKFLKDLTKKINELAKLYVTPKGGSSGIPDEVREFLLLFAQKRKKLETEEDERRQIMEKCKAPLKATEGVSFERIAGMKKEKEEIKMRFVYPIEYPSLYRQKASNNIILYGPPGTGKTFMFNTAISELKNVAFFNPTPGELLGKYEGSTQKNIQAVFDCAQNHLKAHPEVTNSVIFFDEFDSIAQKRGDNPGAERSVNTLLQVMDGVRSHPKVSVVAATNLLSKIDDAILSRFANKIFIDLPSLDARRSMLLIPIMEFYSFPGDKPSERRMNEVAKKYSIKAETIYLGVLKGRIEDVNGTDEKMIEDVAKRLGPADSKEVKDMVTSQGKRTSSREFSSIAISDWGFSSRDIKMYMQSVIDYATSRALSGDARFIKVKENGTDYYVYVPMESENSESFAIGSGFDDMKTRDMFKLSQVPDKTKIISFDLRKSDFEEILKHAKPTVTDYKQYTVVPED